MTSMAGVSTSISDAKSALRSHAEHILQDPRTNSVFSYAQDLFRALESGETDVAGLETTLELVFADLILDRTANFRTQHRSVASVEQRLEALANEGWEVFRSAVETPTGGIVFTGHPTFALPKQVRAAFAQHVSENGADSETALRAALKADGRIWSRSISLEGEHAEVQETLTHAQFALERYAQTVLRVARGAFPEQWRSLSLAVPTLASWVGYDLDGRTDIHWSRSFSLRLAEKAVQLGRYHERVEALAGRSGGAAKTKLFDLAVRLQRAWKLTEKEADLFAADLTRPDNLVEAANHLTTGHEDRIVHSQPIVDELRSIAVATQEESLASELFALATVVDALKLGTSRIHLRLNAQQIQTVISRDLGLETENRDLGRGALNRLSALASPDKALNVNFADLFLEQSTARRQFMMCAQMLKHIDADSTIRFLIAESENPATVMGALYLARQYGVDQKLDISPLFETPEALETGGRFIEQLLLEPEYLSYLQSRGYLSVQLGFSDAGRFIGQISADMAIERIHNLISRAVAAADAGLSLLIFNTHGESMGRGAWPGSFDSRFDHLLSHWTRQQSRERGVALQHEVSFQGGDGYLHFANIDLACSSYDAFALHLLSNPRETSTDPFYAKTDLVWDFYRALRRWHERLFGNRDYGRLLSDFATNFLVKAGSRQRRRTTGPSGPRALRAISHNATLQQLGVPANTAAGIGSALRREQDQVIDLIKSSPRMRGLMQLASKARSVSSVPVLRAYANVYDPTFWVACSKFTADSEKSLAYRRIYYLLQTGDTKNAIDRVANTLSIDFTKFDQMLANMSDTPSAEERREARLDLHILHAIRLALMMKAFSLAGQMPTVSRRHESSVEDIMNLIRQMEIGEAVARLCEIFPASREEEQRLASVSEPGHMTGNPANGYDQLHADIIQPLDEIDRLMHALSLAISQAYGAYG